MPQNRQLVVPILTAGRIGQSNEVEDKSIDRLIWQSVLFVEQYPDEQRVGTWMISH